MMHRLVVLIAALVCSATAETLAGVYGAKTQYKVLTRYF